jgi:hypothetical protein
VTTIRKDPSVASHTATAGPGITTRIRAAGQRLSDRIHAGADDRARTLGWQVTATPGRLGLSGRSYRDPRFTTRRRTLQDAPARTDQRHE